jgi:hypothetical protein
MFHVNRESTVSKVAGMTLTHELGIYLFTWVDRKVETVR